MGHLFKTARQRARDERRDRRQAFNEAENRIADVKDRLRSLEREANKHWVAARQTLASGQQAAAQRHLTSYRAGQVLMTKLEQKRWVFEQYLSKMEVAQTDQEFARALAAVNKVVQIDPERVVDVFEASRDILGEQVDADRFWNKLYEKEMTGAEGALEDRIPTIEELSRQLESEAAAVVGGAALERTGSELDERIRSGQERVKQLLKDS